MESSLAEKSPSNLKNCTPHDPMLRDIMDYVARNETLTVKLYRDYDGNLIFAEATADFVNVLDKVQRLPILSLCMAHQQF